MPDEIAALPRPRLVLLLGGPGAGYGYDRATISGLAARLEVLSGQAGSIMITPSRRTPPALLDAAALAARDKPRLIWNGEGENPYPFFLAAADRFIVTADSVNMTGEACATGKPVHVFFPPGGRAKFRQFHQALRDHGATRPLDETTAALESWTYTPLSAAETVAAEIARRWLLFQTATRGH
jgi:mitochondrial fission protein ELM1